MNITEVPITNDEFNKQLLFPILIGKDPRKDLLRSLEILECAVLSNLSENFTIPAQKLLGADNIYELVNGYEQRDKTRYTLQILDYLDG